MSKITFSDLLKQEAHEPIWVLNTTKGDARGNVFFSVPNTTGSGVDSVTVFASFVPQCLTEIVTRKQLMDSSHLRRAVQKGMLRLVSKDEAESMLDEPGAREEYERVQRLDINSATMEAQYGLGAEAEESQKQAQSGVSPGIIQFVELMDTSTDAEALNTLRSKGELEVADYRYVKSKAAELRYNSVGRYCADQLAKLKN